VALVAAAVPADDATADAPELPVALADDIAEAMLLRLELADEMALLLV
jgi:hypothetical protein